MSFQYITKAGDIAFPGKFLWAGSFWRGTACAHSESFGWGFIDTEGTLKVRAPDFHSEPTEFFDGLAVIKRGRLYSFMDWSGKICVEPQYWSAAPFGDGVAAVRTSNGYTFIDECGRIVMNEILSRLNQFSLAQRLFTTSIRFRSLNQYSQRTVPPYVDVLGSANLV